MTKHWDVAYRSFQDLLTDLNKLGTRECTLGLEAMQNLVTGALRQRALDDEAQINRWKAIAAAADKEV